MNPPLAPTSTAAPPPDCSFYRWEILGWFWIAYFLNQGDRQIYNAVLPLIKADLGASDVELGLVATGFTLVYGGLVGFAGWLSDRFSQKWIVCLSLLVFSIGTLLTGVAGGIVGLLIFRSIATGAGEAFYYPAATAVIARYHRETRAQAMAVHQTAVYVGLIVSSVLAAWIGERYGWRASFYLFGGFGLLVGLGMALRVRNDGVGSGAGTVREPARLVLGQLLRTPSFHLLAFAFGCLVFVHVGVMTWMPTYLYEQFKMPLREAAFHAVFLHLVLASVGVLVGGRVADRFVRRRSTLRIEIKAAGLLLAAPFLVVIGRSSELVWVYVALGAFGFFRGLYDSNLFAALFDFVPVERRATATGLMLAIAFIVGATAPLVLGLIKAEAGLGAGLSALAFVFVAGGLALAVTAKVTFPRDRLAEVS